VKTAAPHRRARRPLTLDLAHEPDDVLRVRAAWLYYVGSLNQAETAARLGITRARTNRLIAEAHERGLVTITIEAGEASMLEVEREIATRFQLDLCLATPPVGFVPAGSRDQATRDAQGRIAQRAVGIAAATFLKGKLAAGEPLTVGVGWGRSLEQMARHLGGVKNTSARFVSVLGSLTRNSASNPFEVVQALAARTSGEGHFLPVPFIADTQADRDILMSQRIVASTLALARSAGLCLTSIGELGPNSLLSRQRMLSAADLKSLRAAGAVGDMLGKFFDPDGKVVHHEITDRTAAVELTDIRKGALVVLGAGLEKVAAIRAILRSGIPKGLIVDGDTALQLVQGDG
jgi:DNA-binding transcriptional regulator LsrR (DeoR family)